MAANKISMGTCGDGRVLGEGGLRAIFSLI